MPTVHPSALCTVLRQLVFNQLMWEGKKNLQEERASKHV